MKWFSKCPLLIALAVSTLFLVVITRYHLQGNLAAYQEKAAAKPALAAFFWGLKDGVYIWEEQIQPSFVFVEETDSIEKEQMQQENMTGGKEQTEENTQTADEIQVQDQAQNEVYDTGSLENAVEQTSVSQNEPDLSLEFVRVEEDYFADALFIGDSRTQAMFEYGGLQEVADFYCKTSLTVHDLFEKNKAFIRVEDEKLTLDEALLIKKFAKIYIMLGINELGTGTDATFLRSYTAAVEKIRQLQPDALIFVQSIMRVAGEKNAKDPIYNNANINARNEGLQTLADGKNVFYIDVNEAVCDENGNLYDNWTFDQIHLKAKYYEVWKEVLKDHGIEKKFYK